jgi:hypothetical protein
MAYTPGLVQIFTPVSGGTVQPADSNANIICIIKPANLLAVLTFNMPQNPFDGQIIRVTSTQIITSLTLALAAFQMQPGTIGVNGFFAMIYVKADTKWYRIG